MNPAQRADVAALRKRITTLEGELEDMRLRAKSAEARIASVSGVTREELVKAEREACALVAQHHTDCGLARNIAAAIRARGVA